MVRLVVMSILNHSSHTAAMASLAPGDVFLHDHNRRNLVMTQLVECAGQGDFGRLLEP